MTSEGPLSGVRVCDLTTFLSGPFATQILGDLGATVFKIEAPDGDMTRRLPPHFVAGESAYFLQVNRNKHSVVLDLKNAEAQHLARELALSCDIVVENFRPGVIERLGLAYEQLASRRPELIMCSISGFGQDGPWRDRPAYDLIVQAMSGTMSLTGEPDGRPVRAGVPVGDIGGGLYGVIAVLAALEERRRTGRGSYLDISMLDAQLSFLSYQAAYHLLSGQLPTPQGRGHDSIPTYRTFTAADGMDVVVAANTERMWSELCRAIDRSDLLDDPRFEDNGARWQHRDELWRELEAAFSRLPAQEACDRLIERSVPAAVVNDIGTALRNPHVDHRDMVWELSDEHGNRVEVVGDPIWRGRGNHADLPARYPPRLGADTINVLRDELGLDPDTLERLAASGAIGGPRAR